MSFQSKKFLFVGPATVCVLFLLASPARACQQGFVWREAVPNDHVCVTPTERAIAAQQNRNPYYTCPRGYVWREAVRGDYRCVTSEERTMTWDQNAKAGERGDQIAIRPPQAPAPPPRAQPVPYGDDLELNPVGRH